MVKKKVGVVVFAATTALLVGCGDDITEVNEMSGTTMSVADTLDKSACTNSTEGNQTFVKDEMATYLCADGEWHKMNSASSGNFSCSAKALKDSTGYTIICNGDSIATIYNGKQGEQGEQGEQGKQGTQGKQGKQGETGETGQTGKTGKTGAGCTLAENDNGATVTCGDKTYSLRDGEDGQDCNVKSQSAASIVVGCGDDDSKDLIIPIYQENENLGKTFTKEIATAIELQGQTSTSSANITVMELNQENLTPTGKIFSFELDSMKKMEFTDNKNAIVLSKNISLTNLQSPYVMACYNTQDITGNDIPNEEFRTYINIFSPQTLCAFVDMSTESPVIIGYAQDYLLERITYLVQNKEMDVEEAEAQAAKDLQASIQDFVRSDEAYLFPESFRKGDFSYSEKNSFLNSKDAFEFITRSFVEHTGKETTNLNAFKKSFAETGNFTGAFASSIYSAHIPFKGEKTHTLLKQILENSKANLAEIAILMESDFSRSFTNTFVAKTLGLPICKEDGTIATINNKNSILNGIFVRCNDYQGTSEWGIAAPEAINGSKCTEENATAKMNGNLFRCEKKNDDLVWKIGTNAVQTFGSFCGPENGNFTTAEGTFIKTVTSALPAPRFAPALGEGAPESSTSEYDDQNSVLPPPSSTSTTCEEFENESIHADYVYCAKREVSGNTCYIWTETDEVTYTNGKCTPEKGRTISQSQKYICNGDEGYWKGCGNNSYERLFGDSKNLFSCNEEDKWVKVNDVIGTCEDGQDQYAPIGGQMFECGYVQGADSYIWSPTNFCDNEKPATIFLENASVFVCNDNDSWEKISTQDIDMECNESNQDTYQVASGYVFQCNSQNWVMVKKPGDCNDDKDGQELPDAKQFTAICKDGTWTEKEVETAVPLEEEPVAEP